MPQPQYPYLPLVEAIRERNGTNSEASPEVHSQGLQEGNASPDLIITLNEFHQACAWLESHTLINYFLDCISSNVVLKN